MSINIARKNYQDIAAIYEAEKVYERFPLGGIWLTNLQVHLSSLVSSAQTAKDAISNLNDKQFYDFTCGGVYKNLTIDWRLEYLRHEEKVGLEDLPEGFGESELILDDHIMEIGGRRLSADFLNRWMWLKRLQRSVTLPAENTVFLEIGGGFGAFMRLIRGFYPQATSIMVDIPETLFFLDTFLRHHFPNGKFLYATDRECLAGDLTEYDFVLVPHYLADGLKGKKIDLLINTNSFGEMHRETIGHWFDLIQNDLEVRFMFSLNRFLNRIDFKHNNSRFPFLAWSFFMDARWNMLDWEVDPLFERCPYLYSIATRNVLIVAERISIKDFDEAEAKEKAKSHFRKIFFEDWNCRPYWDNYVRKFGLFYPPLMSRGDRDLTPDLTMRGSMFRAWDAIRLDRSQDNLALLERMLESLGGAEHPFEEVVFLVMEIAQIAKRDGNEGLDKVSLNMDAENPSYVWN